MKKILKTKIEERAETEQNVIFHFQAPAMLVQKFLREFSSPSTINLFPKPKTGCSKNFCSTAVGLLSRRSIFVSKRKRNKKLTAKNF